MMDSTVYGVDVQIVVLGQRERDTTIRASTAETVCGSKLITRTSEGM